MKNKILAVLTGLSMITTLCACGSAAPAGNETAEEAPVAAEAETETAAESDHAADASAQETSDASDGEKTWIIVTDTSFKPFEYADESGNYVGIDMDLLAAIAEDQGFKYEVQVLSWDAALAACQEGLADGMMAAVSVTRERMDQGWIFSDGYYDSYQCMAVAKDSGISGFGDLAGQAVGVKSGTISAEYALGLSEQYGFVMSYFEDSPTMYRAVLDARVAACFDDAPIMASNVKDNGLDLVMLENTGNEPTPYGFLTFDPANRELIDMFNEGLANVRANGKYDEILDRYLGS